MKLHCKTKTIPWHVVVKLQKTTVEEIVKIAKEGKCYLQRSHS